MTLSCLRAWRVSATFAGLRGCCQATWQAKGLVAKAANPPSFYKRVKPKAHVLFRPAPKLGEYEHSKPCRCKDPVIKDL